MRSAAGPRAMRIAIVTDSHLSKRAPQCVRNWQAVADAVTHLGVDLTVHLGDITTDGQSHPEEIGFAADLLRRWPTPLRCVPGNHDVGDGSGEAPLDRGLLAAYTNAFGVDRWAVRAGRWELIGLNAQLLASDTPEEAAQWRWLEAGRACRWRRSWPAGASCPAAAPPAGPTQRGRAQPCPRPLRRRCGEPATDRRPAA